MAGIAERNQHWYHIIIISKVVSWLRRAAVGVCGASAIDDIDIAIMQEDCTYLSLATDPWYG